MLRQGLLWLSENKRIDSFVRSNGLAQHFASRFVAGEGVEDAVAAAAELGKTEISATVDLLGEAVTDSSSAIKARDEYLALIDHLAQAGLEVNVSVKPTQMGLLIDPAVCRDNIEKIVQRAAGHDGFVRIDMEDSDTTDATLAIYFDHLPQELKSHAGLVMQSMLRRTSTDLDRLIAEEVRVRLCKGAYLEPPDVAFPDKRDVDRSYVELMERLLLEGNYPGIATHDEKIIDHAREFIARHDISPDRYEFQMLYGVRRDVQRRLRASGHRLRVYVPYGRQWYPYLMRRLAERPANIAFIMGSIVRESLPRP